MHELINQLKTKQLIWQGSYTQPATTLRSTGFKKLDERLGGGLPISGVVEIKSSISIGELRLLLPQIKSQRDGRMIVFIHPPGRLCAEQLLSDGIELDNVLVISPKKTNDALWAAEQCLKSGSCSHVFLWQKELSIHHIRRLQVASEQGECLHFLLRENSDYSFSLPVSLAMTLQPHATGLEVIINKRKGGWAQGQFVLGMETFSIPHCNHIDSQKLRKLG